jgi:porphyrinogen peroxidase
VEAPLTQYVVAGPARSAIVLVLTVRPGGEQQVRDLLGDLSGLTRGVRFRAPEDDLACVAGIGSDLWDRLLPDHERPRGLHPFVELHGRHHAPSTPGDLVVHLRAARFDLCFELAKQVRGHLDGAADVVDEMHGFRYFDERDVLGFVDGTENPSPAAAAPYVYVGAADPTYAGSSYLVTQRYLHDLAAWEALNIEQQEAAIGRRKLDDVEIPDDEKAPDSHLALNVIEDADGNEQKIVRENMVFGEVGTAEFGTYFIGYAADPGVIETMLRHMFVGEPEGNTDRILDFSTATTGSLFFVPTADFLDALGD